MSGTRSVRQFYALRRRQVRERSGAPMHEVKTALVATSWDIGAPGARSKAVL